MLYLKFLQRSYWTKIVDDATMTYYDGSTSLSSVEVLAKELLEREFWNYIRKKITLSELVLGLKMELEKKMFTEIPVLNESKPPVHIEDIENIDKFKITFRETDDCKSIEATTKPCEGGFIVTVSTMDCSGDGKVRRSKGRIRSSKTHEIMHTLFYDRSGNTPVKLGSPPRTNVLRMAEEDICRYLARAALMPKKLLMERIVGPDPKTVFLLPSMENLIALANEFEVTHDIVAWRLLKDLNLWRGIFFRISVNEGSVKTDSVVNSRDPFFNKIVIPKNPNSNTMIGRLILRIFQDVNKNENIHFPISYGYENIRLSLNGRKTGFKSVWAGSGNMYFSALVYNI